MESEERVNLLIIGNVGRLMGGDEDFNPSDWRIYDDVMEGLEAASSGEFSLTAVVMQDFSGRLESILKALRKANPEGRVILLSRMSDEPRAMALTTASRNGSRLADDYLICPAELSRLKSFLEGSVRGGVDFPGTSLETVAGKRGENERIKTYRQKIRKLERLVVTDELTGLKNRRYVIEFARQIIECARKEGKQVTLLMFDIDDFKHYNDVYGHTAGDDILRQAAILMKRCCRQHDVVARIGGDEFAVIFWQLSESDRQKQAHQERRSRSEHPEEAIFISKRFRQELKDARLDSLGPEGKGVLTISGGLATFPRDGSTVEQLLKQADNALLDAKQSGKNRIYLVGKSENDISDIS